MTTLQWLFDAKIIAILRGCDPAHTPDIAHALAAGGIRALEVTLNSPDALETIKALNKQIGDRVLIGAGTVLDKKEAETAITAGAKFIISPTLDAHTIVTTREMGAVSIPGAFTATEILQAYRHGADIVKVFPASVGPKYFKDLRGPLSHIPLMPTGGVSLENITEFKKAGAVAFGIGSALVDGKKAVTPEYLQYLKTTAAQFLTAVQ